MSWVAMRDSLRTSAAFWLELGLAFVYSTISFWGFGSPLASATVSSWGSCSPGGPGYRYQRAMPREDDIPRLAALAARVGKAPSSPSRPSASASGASGQALDAAVIADLIRNRAATIRRPREYIGLFEFATWCWARSRNVLLNMGTEWVSMDDWYPYLQARTRGQDSKDAVHIAAAYWNGAHWCAVHDAYKTAVRHYVIAYPCGLPIASAEAVVVPRLDMQLRNLGFMLITTAAQGDCGIDALAYYDNEYQRRGPEDWKELRHLLAREMSEHAGEPAWQEIFKACWETPDENPGVLKQAAGDEREDAVGGPGGYCSRCWFGKP